MKGEKKVGTIRHAYTSFSVTLHVFLVRMNGGPSSPEASGEIPSGWFLPEEARRLPMPAANVKILARWVEEPELDS